MRNSGNTSQRRWSSARPTSCTPPRHPSPPCPSPASICRWPTSWKSSASCWTSACRSTVTRHRWPGRVTTTPGPRHIRHLLTTDLAVTLACSLILSPLDYCNSVLYGAQAGSIQKLQRVQNTAARITLQTTRREPAEPLLKLPHWLPVHQRIQYKLATLTYKIRHTTTPSYLSRHIQSRQSARQLRSSSKPLLCKPTTRTHFADRAFRCSAPAVWISLPADIVDCTSLAAFRTRLKTYLFRVAFRHCQHWLSVRRRLWGLLTYWRHIS